MPNKIHISNTFEAIRQLPLDVSFQQVKQWVWQHQNPNSSLPPSQLSRWKIRFKRWFKK